MHILGISCYFHDAAAAILRDGDLVAAAEEERFTRKKHDAGFPVQSIAFCLASAGITGSEVDYVVFYEKPFSKFERILKSSLQTFPKSCKLFRESMVSWLVDKLWIRQTIESHLGVQRDRILFAEHHLAHAASAFYASPFDDAAILTVDGVGEWSTATSGIGSGPDLRLTKEMRFPHSIGLLYSAFTAFLGFEVNEGEYKVMGLAPYGEPRYVDKVTQVVCQFDDGSIELDMSYFSFHHSMDRMVGRKFERLFGAARQPESDLPVASSRMTDRVQYYADIAASIQCVTEEILLKMVSVLRSESGVDSLCMAGGVALNSVANGRILRKSGFKRLFVQPAAGDSGGALGAALWAYHGLLGYPRQFQMRHASWGASYSDDRIAAVLDAESIDYRACRDEHEMLDATSELLARGKVVGWFQGRFEWGPRALGHRSILADPRRADMRDIVNGQIKLREPFRPFAPAVLSSRASEYFDVEGDLDTQRFMLSVSSVKDGKRDDLAATTHVDGSARVQAVFEEDSPLFHGLIERFGEATGTPALLNTSFNQRGEPIVASPEDAYRTFVRSDLDALVLGNHIVLKKTN